MLSVSLTVITSLKDSLDPKRNGLYRRSDSVQSSGVPVHMLSNGPLDTYKCWILGGLQRSVAGVSPQHRIGKKPGSCCLPEAGGKGWNT